MITMYFSGGMIPTFLLAPFVGTITKKVGKKEASAIGCIIGGCSSLLLFFMKVKSPVLFIIISMIGYIGFGFFNMVIWAIITDVIDDQEVRTGKREDGTIYAVYSFARKIGQALAGGMGGYALALIGYDETVQIQTQAVADGIYNIATIVPGILYIGVGVVLFVIYPLGKRRVQENIEILKNKRMEE